MIVNAAINDKIKSLRNSSVDTGSSQVQILNLTDKIFYLADHVGKNHKDQSAKRALNILVGNRRRLLAYLKRTSLEMFEKVSKAMVKN